MKYSGLRNQLAALRAQLPDRRLRIRVEGGLPKTGTAAAVPAPEQLESPLPKPPPRPSAAQGRVKKPWPITAETAPRPPLADCEPDKASDWERDWWEHQRQRRR